MTNPNIQPRARGFAAMDQRKQREIASRGGRAAHALGTAHKFSPEEARMAGRKGGEAVSGDRGYMASIGRRGGEARHARNKARAAEAAVATPASVPESGAFVARVEATADATNQFSS
jgi:uncharacterized protein